MLITLSGFPDSRSSILATVGHSCTCDVIVFVYAHHSTLYFQVHWTVSASTALKLVVI